MTKQGVAALVAVALLASTPLAVAQEAKIGVVVLERILRDSAAAKAAQQKLEAEFSKRDRELQDMGARLKTGAERFEKDAPVMTETDRSRRQRELAEMDREFQRKQREFREDLNQRRNEELREVVEQANRVIRQIKDLIWRGEVTPGEYLPPQPVLAAQLGVGLSTVREAIKALSLIGLLEPLPGRGTLVMPDAAPTEARVEPQL